MTAASHFGAFSASFSACFGPFRAKTTRIGAILSEKSTEIGAISFRESGLFKGLPWHLLPQPLASALFRPLMGAGEAGSSGLAAWADSAIAGMSGFQLDGETRSLSTFRKNRKKIF